LIAALNTPEPAGLSLIAMGALQLVPPLLDFVNKILGLPDESA
jgi:hypothetical protein